MQMEAPSPLRACGRPSSGDPNAYIFEDKLINTREVRGAMGEPVAALMTPLLAAAALAVVVLLIWALRRGADAGQLLIAGSLALVAAFIVFNKVGSPQFMLWLGAVVAVGVAWEGTELARAGGPDAGHRAADDPGVSDVLRRAVQRPEHCGSAGC